MPARPSSRAVSGSASSSIALKSPSSSPGATVRPASPITFAAPPTVVPMLAIPAAAASTYTIPAGSTSDGTTRQVAAPRSVATSVPGSMPWPVTPGARRRGWPPTTSSVAAGSRSRRRANAATTASPRLRSHSRPTNRKRGRDQSRRPGGGTLFGPNPTTCTFSGATPWSCMIDSAGHGVSVQHAAASR